MKRILGIIPARGGSKGVVRKNIRLLAGKPLIVHTIDTAERCELLTDVIISTDDLAIAEICRAHGARVPFLRPEELATDRAKSLDVCLHALDFFAGTGKEYDYLVLLQPTSPLRSVTTLRESIELILGNPDAESLITVTHAGNMHPNYMYHQSRERENYFEPLLRDDGGAVRRQDMKDYYYRNGAVYITKVEYLRTAGRVFSETSMAYVMPAEESVNIDTEFDLFLAEQIIQHRDCL